MKLNKIKIKLNEARDGSYGGLDIPVLYDILSVWGSTLLYVMKAMCKSNLFLKVTVKLPIKVTWLCCLQASNSKPFFKVIIYP